MTDKQALETRRRWRQVGAEDKQALENVGLATGRDQKWVLEPEMEGWSHYGGGEAGFPKNNIGLIHANNKIPIHIRRMRI
jgi:hypothetical protein